MDIAVYEKAALFEHRFWLQILGDHSRFMLNAFSHEETEAIHQARRFMGIFDRLLDQARQDIAGTQLTALTQQAYLHTAEIRAFKTNLLKLSLIGKIKINMTPTFFNHMLNELEEYTAVLNMLISGNLPVFHPVCEHLLWLLDGAGHAISVASSLDDVEKDLIKKSMKFMKEFDNLYIKSFELYGYMRTGLENFPALSRLNCKAEATMVPFKAFLEEMLLSRLSKTVLGTLTPLMADHMAREECYYLIKLSKASEVKAPDCDPGRPRAEE